MTEKKELSVLRQQIDNLDYKIHDLINARAQLALQILDVKLKHGRNDAVLYRPQRERNILDRLQNANQGPLSDTAITEIFQLIIKECRQLQLHFQEKKHHD